MNADSFLDRAGPLLLADEARNNLVFGIAGLLRENPGRYPEARFWVAFDGGEAVAAALRTPPFNLVLAKPRDHDALAALADIIDDEPPGIVGAQPEVEEFTRLWAERHVITPRPLRAQGILALERIQPVPGASGALRDATRADRPLLLKWMVAFGDEVLAEEDPGRTEAVGMVDDRLDSPQGGFVIWEDEAAAVSIAGYGGPTPNGIRIGPVYTAPEVRGRGYATALVADLSQRLLESGRRFCFLFTDLANPTSNAIYERIGYVRIAESAMVAYERG